VAGICEVHKVTGTAAFTAGADLDITSRNLGSNAAPTGTFKSDTNTTGLTSGGVLWYLTLEADKYLQFKSSSNVILSPGTALALRWDTGTGVLSGTISMNFVDEGSN
jgi:hypothetical protein